MEIEQNVHLEAASDMSQMPECGPEVGISIEDCMRVLFTGYYNGMGVEVRSADEINLLYHMGCFGKGSFSRSKPGILRNQHNIIRNRQFLKRIQWAQRFEEKTLNERSNNFLKDVSKLATKLHEVDRAKPKEVIDLVSSEDEIAEIETDGNESHDAMETSIRERLCKDDFAVVVPNSDSEGENYFANFKPKCCITKAKVEEKLILSQQEAFFLAYGLGCLQVIDIDNKALNLDQLWKLFCEVDSEFIIKYVVYHYFRAKGYVVKSGLKFGGDYLIYKEGPSVTHADYIVVIKTKDALQSGWLEMLGHVRMAVTTSKEILVAEVIKTGEIPQAPGLENYRVHEIRLTRNIPGLLNDSTED